MLYHPTGGTSMRSDSAGSGEFKSARGSRRHAGKDYLCRKQQWVFAPEGGILTRGLYVYPGDYQWHGVEIVNSMIGLTFKLFYVRVLDHKIGTRVVKGERVGKAQAISEKYPGQGMKDHVHLQVEIHDSHLYERKGKIYVNPNTLGIGLPPGGM